MYYIPIEPMPHLISVYEIERQTYWSCADENNILVCILEGSCCFTVLNQEYYLSAGQVILLPARQEYHRRPIDGQACRFVYLHFSGQISYVSENEEFQQSMLSGNDESFIYLQTITDISSNKDEIKSLLNRLLKSARKNEFRLPSLMLMEFLTYVEKESMRAYRIMPVPGSSALPPSLSMAVDYIRAHFDSKFTLAKLAEIAGLSPQHLNRLFKKNLKCSAIEYVNNLRISHAVELLRSSNLTIEEISYLLGFSSPAYFSRVFKQIKGLSPNSERNRIKHFNN